mmetsp:Transcript_9460/g.10965  ORF Transcript_9460/g.10965 Transcript_9460/m.10965 type:complete len:82 (+) Transcript_9460:33-278(+)
MRGATILAKTEVIATPMDVVKNTTLTSIGARRVSSLKNNGKNFMVIPLARASTTSLKANNLGTQYNAEGEWLLTIASSWSS